MKTSTRTTCAIAALIALTGTADAAVRKERPGAFDLQCKGMQNRWTGGNADAWSDRLRVDLDAKRWCRGECMSPAPIEEITPDRFRMLDSRGAALPRDAEMVISRTDGSMIERVKLGSAGTWTTIVEAFCTRDRFTGFQPTKF